MQDKLDVDLIEARTDTKVVIYNSTASTNDIAWRYATCDKYDGLAVIAEFQTQGRGRRGSKWQSEKSQSILCSILMLNCPCDTEIATLAVPVAIAETLKKFEVPNPRIKWPNDILVNAKKIAGVLIESRNASAGRHFVIGIGINCHQNEQFFSNIDLAMPATSVDMETGRFVDRNRLAAELINSVKGRISSACTDTDMISSKWKQLSAQLGHRVCVKHKGESFSGNCIGIDPVEGLILQLDSGAVRMFHAAHTTIIKQQQY